MSVEGKKKKTATKNWQEFQPTFVRFPPKYGETREVSLFRGPHLSITWFWCLFPCLLVPNPSVVLPVFSSEPVVTGDSGQSDEYLNTLFTAPFLQ